MTGSILDTEGLLERAKDMLVKYRKLLPVLFVETDKNLYVIGMNVDFDKIDKVSMMRDIGIDLSRRKEDIVHLCIVSMADVSMYSADKDYNDIANIENIKDSTDIETYEAIIIVSLCVKDNKRSAIIQKFEISDDEVIFKDVHRDQCVKGTSLLDMLLQGYYQNNMTLN